MRALPTLVERAREAHAVDALGALVRDENAFQVRARAVENPNVADAVHKCASGPFCERRERGVAGIAISPSPSL